MASEIILPGAPTSSTRTLILVSLSKEMIAELHFDVWLLLIQSGFEHWDRQWIGYLVSYRIGNMTFINIFGKKPFRNARHFSVFQAILRSKVQLSPLQTYATVKMFKSQNRLFPSTPGGVTLTFKNKDPKHLGCTAKWKLGSPVCRMDMETVYPIVMLNIKNKVQNRIDHQKLEIV